MLLAYSIVGTIKLADEKREGVKRNYYSKACLLFSLVAVLHPAVTYAQSDGETCLVCHDDVGLTGVDEHGIERTVFVDIGLFEVSVHGGFDCVDCHWALAGVEDFPHSETLEKVDCAQCHADVFYRSHHQHSRQWFAREWSGCNGHVHRLSHRPSCSSRLDD